MADTPVDTVDTPVNEAAPAETAAPEVAADATPEEKPAKKAAAKKTAAKKAPAKKAAAAKKAPAKKAAAKKAPAAAKAAKAEAEPEPTTDASGEASGTAEDDAQSTSGTAVLFQPPAKKAPARKAKPKPKAEPTDGDEDEKADSAEKSEDAKGGDAPAKKAPAKKSTTAPKSKAETVEDDQDAADSGDESDDSDAEQGEGGEGGTSSAARRRRRRGGRRRRKPAGAGAAGGVNGDDDADDTDESADGDSKAAGDAGTDESADSADVGDADAEGGEQGEGGSSSSSRRRRRRRREGEGGSDADDSTTVTRVRKPRSPEDEITSISGSTRLEAKKQRRRDGREAGRRRAPIVSEAEFLARRESVDRVMVVRQRKDLTQIAVMEDKVLVEHYVARESQTSLIGNVYLGRVQNVLPSMEAAFIDIGKGRNAVLYAGEVNWSSLGHKDGQPRKIESVLTSGQSILVQVTKDPIGHKGARLTSQVSLAGRFLVYVPDGTTSGISRKLPDTERGRLKTLLKEIVPETAGVIVRTAAEGASEDELTRDVERLKARWEDIEKKVAKGNAPQLLYGEPDLTLKVVRDLFTEDFAKLVVQGDDAWETVHDYVEHMAPDLADRLEHYKTSVEGEPDKPDVFASYRIDEQIAKGLDRKVWLPSGGSLVIDRTEAMTVVDVNTGKFTGSGGNLEETVTKNNLEAAEEIVRQLRLRDIGGIIVVDFIDMVLESNRDLVLRRLVECLGRDRTRHQVAEVTSLGLVQMTRKRIGTGLVEAFSENCDHCQGRGIVIHELPVEPRRGSGDDESRGGGRRRRGKGNDRPQADEPVSKAVPSPKDIAAMAKPPAPDEDEDGAADELTEAVEAHAVVEPHEAVAETSPEATPASPAEPAEASELVKTLDAVAVAEATEPTPEPEPEPAPQPTPEAPVEPAAPRVVTRTRRGSASRPAGPPTSTSTPEPAPEPVVEPEPDETPVVPEVEAAADAPVEEPHVEHVPIKKKGTRKR